MSPELRADRAKRRRVLTLARRIARWERQRALLEATPHPSKGRHAQRLGTIAWHLDTLRMERNALVKELKG